MNDKGALLKAAALWERTSAQGNRYFSGRLGGVKVVILENRERQGGGDPTHFLFFAEASGKQAAPAVDAPAAAPRPRARAKAPSARTRDLLAGAQAPHAPASSSGDPVPFDDPIGF